jgi:hypothetical protein
MKWENIKYKERNNWKKYLYWLLIWLVWNISLNKDHLWDYACDYQERPQALCSGSNRGARVELLLQVGDLHLYFLVKFYDLICYWCEMWITERWILGEMRKVCVMMSIFWIVFLMYVYSRWMVVVWIAKWQNYRWQMKYEKCDLGRELAYI